MSTSSKINANHRERWGYSFQWTDEHLPQEEIDQLRSHYDELGSNVLEELQAIVAEAKVELLAEAPSPAKPDLYTVLKDHHEDDGILEEFWNELHSVPDFVDWKQIERAQRFFARYAVANSTAFALQGFIRENSVGSHEHCAPSFVMLTNTVGVARYHRSLRSNWRLCHQELTIPCHRNFHMAHSSHQLP